jgi:hypothetical protein
MPGKKVFESEESRQEHLRKLHNERMKRYYQAHKDQQRKVIDRNNARFQASDELREKRKEYMKAYRQRKALEASADSDLPVVL